jgi:hypothetical protein
MRIVTIQSGAMMNMTISMELDLEVTEASNNQFKTETKISAVELNMFQAGMNINYSSKNKDQASDPISQEMAKQFEPMLQAVIHSTVNSLGEMLNVNIEPPVEGMDGNSASRGNIKYPEKKVKVGDSCEATENNNGMNVNSKYAVSKIENGIVYLDVSGDLTGASSGKVSGYSEIEIATGIQKNAEVEMTMSIEGMDVKVKVKTTTSKK